jgi:hypothetical protein
MPEVSELSQYQQSTDALAPLLADQGTWFDPAPLPPRPPLMLVPRRGADAWHLSALSAALPSFLQQVLATPPRVDFERIPAPGLELRPLNQSQPVGVLGWELPGARPPPAPPRNPAGADWPLRAFTSSTPLLSLLDQPPNEPPPGIPPRLGAPALELRPLASSTPLLSLLDQPSNRPPPGTLPRIGAPSLELRPFTASTPLLPALDQPTARGPASGLPPRPTEQAQPLGAGIVFPTGWETAVALSPVPSRPRQVPDVFTLSPLIQALGVTGWEVPPLPPRAPATIPRPAPLSYPPGTIIPLTVNPSWGWAPPGQVPPRVPWIPRLEIADPPGNFLLPPFASTGWEPQGAGPRAPARIARFEIAGPAGSPVVVLLPTGWEPALLRPPVPARVPAAGSALPNGFPILPWGWDMGAPQARPQKNPVVQENAPPPGFLILPWGWDPANPQSKLVVARPLVQDAVLQPLPVLLAYFNPDAPGRVLLVRGALPAVQAPGSPLIVLRPTGWEPASPPPRRPNPSLPAHRFHGGADLGRLLPPPAVAVFLDVEPTLYRQRVRYPFELLVVPTLYPVLPPLPVPKFPLPPPFAVQLLDADGPANLTGLTVICRTMPADRTRAVHVEAAEVLDRLRGLVQKTWTEQDLRGVPTGDMLVQFVTIDGAGRPRTYPGGGHYYHVQVIGRGR